MNTVERTTAAVQRILSSQIQRRDDHDRMTEREAKKCSEAKRRSDGYVEFLSENRPLEKSIKEEIFRKMEKYFLEVPMDVDEEKDFVENLPAFPEKELGQLKDMFISKETDSKNWLMLDADRFSRIMSADISAERKLHLLSVALGKLKSKY